MLTNILTELDRIFFFFTEVKDRIANITEQDQLTRMYRLILFYNLRTTESQLHVSLQQDRGQVK